MTTENRLLARYGRRMAGRLVVTYGRVPAHELLRTGAAAFHGIAPDRVVVGHACPRCGSDEHGRPTLLATASLRAPAHVSLARAGDLSVVAITDIGPVGVDTEPDGAAGFPGLDDVARHREERSGDTTCTWVRKEALLKATGHGLSVDPRDVRLDEHGLAAWESPLAPPEHVWMRDVDVPGHAVAVVVLPERGEDVADLVVELRAG